MLGSGAAFGHPHRLTNLLTASCSLLLRSEVLFRKLRALRYESSMALISSSDKCKPHEQSVEMSIVACIQ